MYRIENGKNPFGGWKEPELIKRLLNKTPHVEDDEDMEIDLHNSNLDERGEPVLCFINNTPYGVINGKHYPIDDAKKMILKWKIKNSEKLLASL